jgi:hypothetical protein
LKKQSAKGGCSKKQKSRKAEKQKSRKAEKQKSRKAEKQKSRKAEGRYILSLASYHAAASGTHIIYTRISKMQVISFDE